MAITIEKDKIRIIKITLLPISLILFTSFNLLNNNHLDKPLWGINRMYFYIPGLIFFSALIIMNLVTLFMKDYKIEIGENLFFRTSLYKVLGLIGMRLKLLN